MLFIPRATMRSVHGSLAAWQLLLFLRNRAFPKLQCMLALLLVFGSTSRLLAEGEADVKIWEFAAYEVDVLYGYDSTVSISNLAKSEFQQDLLHCLERTFRAAWRPNLKPVGAELLGLLTRDFEGFELADLRHNELVVVVSSTSENTRAIRTFEAALESSIAIHVSQVALDRLKQAAGDLSDPQVEALIAKCVVDEGGLEGVLSGLRENQLTAALVPRSAVGEVSQVVRPIITPLPWQTDSLFRSRDKVFFVLVGQREGRFVLRVRELDCPMQFLGPAFVGQSVNWFSAARATAALFQKAFAPVARVEEAETNSAVLLLKAGGLIVDSDNPAAVHPGELMQPIIRRDDRNGVPTLLQALPWTFAAVTQTDGIEVQANVYSYSGGPGLKGRQNRRTQRMLLRVRPRFVASDIEVLVRGTDKPQAGCFVYEKDLLTDEFNLLGRTDWRGRFTVPVPEDLGRFLPADVRARKLQAERDARNAAAPTGGANAEMSLPTDVSASKEQASQLESNFDTTAFEIPLRSPLKQIYVKSGDTVLAKLPMVPGLELIEIAELPDDSRRLEAEAFVRGFQGEILDLIGLRNLLAARIKLSLQDGDIEAAKLSLRELRGLKNYTEMADELGTIQRKMLDESRGELSLGIRGRIDRMFGTTREMLQKYLQDSLVDDSTQAVQRAEGSG